MTQPRQPGQIHATSIMMVLLLAGISTLFLGASAAYIYSRFSTGIPAPFPPLLFYINIPVLFCATRVLRKIKSDWMEMAGLTVRRGLFLVFGITCVFIVLQVIGWLLFFDTERSIGSTQSMSYLFVLSALHMLHVLAGLPFLIALMLRMKRYFGRLISEPVLLQRYTSAVTLYWNFLDVLWILLVILLTASALLS